MSVLLAEYHEWMDRAACKNGAREGFADAFTEPAQFRAALRICRKCPPDVVKACREYGRHYYGVWGGQINRKPEPDPNKWRFDPIYGCGTEAGSMRHKRLGETPCAACYTAAAVVARNRKIRRGRQ